MDRVYDSGIILIFFFRSLPLVAKQLAFPTAEDSARFASGGRDLTLQCYRQ